MMQNTNVNDGNHFDGLFNGSIERVLAMIYEME
jgi:hypothetical protein